MRLKVRQDQRVVIKAKEAPPNSPNRKRKTDIDSKSFSKRSDFCPFVNYLISTVIMIVEVTRSTRLLAFCLLGLFLSGTEDFKRRRSSFRPSREGGKSPLQHIGSVPSVLGVWGLFGLTLLTGFSWCSISFYFGDMVTKGFI